MSRAFERPARPNPRLWVFVAGPLSIFVGLLLALIAFAISDFQAAGNPREGIGFCSPEGEIGSYQTAIPGHEVVYFEEGWGGFPPRAGCGVYLVDSTTDANPPLSVEEKLRRDPSPHRLAHDSFPGTRAYAWIIGLLLLPTALWATLAVGSGLRRRQAWRRYL